jgi:hypothetical protein
MDSTLRFGQPTDALLMIWMPLPGGTPLPFANSAASVA